MRVGTVVDIDIDEMAEAFVHSGSDEQARFLNKVGEIFKNSDFNAEMQCCYLSDDIDKDGRDFLYTVANFVKARGVACGSPKEGTLLNQYPGDSLDFDKGEA